MKIAMTALLLLLVHSFTLGQSTLQDGINFADQKEYDKAKTIFESIAKQEKKNAEVRYRLGALLLSPYRNYDDAIDMLEEAVDLESSNAKYVWMLGNAYGAKARVANVFSQMSLAGKVKNSFIRAVELDPNDLRYRQSLMGYYLAAPGIVGGGADKAKDQAKAILRISPYDGHIAFGQIAASEKESATEEQEYKKAIAVDPKKFRAYHLLGYTYLRAKKYDDAIAQFTKYVETAPDDANSFDSLGEALLEKGDVDGALTQFKKGVSVNPKFAPPFYNLGICYERKSMKNEAAQAYRDYLALEQTGSLADKAKKKVHELGR